MRASMRRHCAACGADVIQLSVFSVRRKRPFSCPQCGAKLAIVVPTATYNFVMLCASVLASLLVPVLMIAFFMKQWTTIAMGITALFAIIFGSNEFLNRRVFVQRAAETNPR